MDEVIILGNGEAFSKNGGNTSFLINRNNGAILIDCGYQVPAQLWQFNEYQNIELILVTHQHADHSFGIPPLLARFWEEKRTREISIWGPVGIKDFLLRLMEMAYPRLLGKLQYQILFYEFEEQGRNGFGDVQISAFQTQHSVQCYGYRLDDTKKGWSVSVSGDGKIDDKSLEVIKDSKLHFQEIYSVHDEIPTHFSWVDLERMLGKVAIGKLGVCHVKDDELNLMRRKTEDLMSIKGGMTSVFLTQKQARFALGDQ